MCHSTGHPSSFLPIPFLPPPPLIPLQAAAQAMLVDKDTRLMAVLTDKQAAEADASAERGRADAATAAAAAAKVEADAKAAREATQYNQAELGR